MSKDKTETHSPSIQTLRLYQHKDGGVYFVQDVVPFQDLILVLYKERSPKGRRYVREITHFEESFKLYE